MLVPELRDWEEPSIRGWWAQRRFHAVALSGLAMFDAVISYLAVCVWKIASEAMPVMAALMNVSGCLAFLVFKTALALGMPMLSLVIYMKYREGGSPWELVFERWYWVLGIVLYGVAAVNSVYHVWG